jgi:hypothetical protein
MGKEKEARGSTKDTHRTEDIKNRRKGRMNENIRHVDSSLG